MSDGVKNSNGFLWAAVAPGFLAFIPVTNYLASEGGLVQKLLEGVIGLIPGSGDIAKDRMIPAISAFYIFTTFAATGAFSVGAQAASRPQGLDNNTPRAHQAGMTGLPLRIRSAHLNLMEMFPGFALSAALAQVIAPGNQQIINLLGLHVLAKTFMFFPAYVLDIAPPRSLAHLLATSSVIGVSWKLATGAR